MRIQLIAWDNGRGLSHDLRLLRETLTALGHHVDFAAVPPGRRQRLRAWRRRLRLAWRALRHREPWRYDLGIMLEHALPDYLPLARRNAFIPNPEWLSPRDERHLHRFDAILTKTCSATATFAVRDLRVHYIGFRSVDCHRAGVARDAGVLHLAGASRMKGTARLLATWARHPEWPRLLVLQSADVAASMPDVSGCANIEHRTGRVPDIEQIRRLQNAFALHACLSEAEGWGHYIVEAMSCGAMVLGCDAPPMNELVDATRGLPVAAHATGPLNLATCYAFDEASLEAAVARWLAMPDSDRIALGAAARDWFERNDAAFAERLAAALAALESGAAHGAGPPFG